jgi:hypothetical protein
MFDVLFIYCTMVYVSGLSLIQTRQHWIIFKICKRKTLSSLSSKASVLDVYCTYLLYLSIGLQASISVGIMGIPMCHLFPCIILVI